MKMIPLGWQPIAEKGFVFEMTVDLHVIKDGKYDLATSKSIPSGLRSLIKEGGTINTEMGRGIASWCGAGDAIDVDFVMLKRNGLDAVAGGFDSFVEWGKTLTPQQREKISPFLPVWTKEAKQNSAMMADVEFSKEGEQEND
jgi:hypothetical protein